MDVPIEHRPKSSTEFTHAHLEVSEKGERPYLEEGLVGTDSNDDFNFSPEEQKRILRQVDRRVVVVLVSRTSLSMIIFVLANI
jgi:hypothetical protein